MQAPTVASPSTLQKTPHSPGDTPSLSAIPTTHLRHKAAIYSLACAPQATLFSALRPPDQSPAKPRRMRRQGLEPKRPSLFPRWPLAPQILSSIKAHHLGHRLRHARQGQIIRHRLNRGTDDNPLHQHSAACRQGPTGPCPRCIPAQMPEGGPAVFELPWRLF